MMGAYKGLQTQGRKSIFMAPRALKERPEDLKYIQFKMIHFRECIKYSNLRMIGRHDVWNPYGAPWTK